MSGGGARRLTASVGAWQVNNDRRFTVRADIHLWEAWDKIVIVDIDGTVRRAPPSTPAHRCPASRPRTGGI